MTTWAQLFDTKLQKKIIQQKHKQKLKSPTGESLSIATTQPQEDYHFSKLFGNLEVSRLLDVNPSPSKATGGREERASAVDWMVEVGELQGFLYESWSGGRTKGVYFKIFSELI